MTPTQELESALTEANIPFTVENDIIEIPRLGFHPILVHAWMDGDDYDMVDVQWEKGRSETIGGISFAVERVKRLWDTLPRWSPDWPTKAGAWYWVLRCHWVRPTAMELSENGKQLDLGDMPWYPKDLEGTHFLPITLPDTTLLEEHLKKLREGK